MKIQLSFFPMPWLTFFFPEGVDWASNLITFHNPINIVEREREKEIA